MHRYVQRTTLNECIIMIQEVRYRANLTDADKDGMLMHIAGRLLAVERAITAEIDDMVEDWMVD